MHQIVRVLFAVGDLFLHEGELAVLVHGGETCSPGMVQYKALEIVDRMFPFTISCSW